MGSLPGNGADKSARRGGSPYPKVDFAPRALAKVADLIVAGLFAWIVPSVGPLLALAFLLFCDGLPNGQSPGKRLLGVKAVHVPSRRSVGVRQSIVRNLPVAVAFGFALNPFLAFVAVPIVLFELYMAYSDALGVRIGDVFADTQVIDTKIPLASETRERLDVRRERLPMPGEVSEPDGVEPVKTFSSSL